MRRFRCWTTVALSSALAACGSHENTVTCVETGPYACQSGLTEPLYPFQWYMDAANSYFAAFPSVSDGRTDLNVRQVHESGIKGKGIRILVLDQGVDIRHEDLAENIDRAMCYNFDNGTNDPSPSGINESHGTHTAGIIAAAQNGFGVMGIAPKAIIGSANLVGHSSIENLRLAFGNADWSKRADIFVHMSIRNYTYPFEDSDPDNTALINLSNLRQGKGAVMVKPAGNAYFGGRVDNQFIACEQTANASGLTSCSNSGYDTDNQYPTVIVTAAATAKGGKAKYSTAGSVNWVTALSDPGASAGNYGEYIGQLSDYWDWGPGIFSADLTGCDRGLSRVYDSADTAPKTQFVIAGTRTNQDVNLDKNGRPNCNYADGGGTSSAGPQVAGVIALMLEANPDLTWRDIRDILQRTANHQFDAEYGQINTLNRQLNLTTHALCEGTDPALIPGSQCARVDYGWQTNAAGNRYSNWYGFGLINAKAAVDAAMTTRAHKISALGAPTFRSAVVSGNITYGEVSLIGQFSHAETALIDAVQLRINSIGTRLCNGLLGIYLVSPSGTVSILQTPYNILQNGPDDQKYLLGQDNIALTSYAFYGEQSQGNWKIYAVSGASTDAECRAGHTGQIKVDYRIWGLR